MASTTRFTILDTFGELGWLWAEGMEAKPAAEDEPEASLGSGLHLLNSALAYSLTFRALVLLPSR